MYVNFNFPISKCLDECSLFMIHSLDMQYLYKVPTSFVVETSSGVMIISNSNEQEHPTKNKSHTTNGCNGTQPTDI